MANANSKNNTKIKMANANSNITNTFLLQLRILPVANSGCFLAGKLAASHATQPTSRFLMLEFQQHVARATIFNCCGLFNMHKPMVHGTLVFRLI